MNSPLNAAATTGAFKAGAACTATATVLLLACVTARVFISEMPYRGPLLNASVSGGDTGPAALPASQGREELSRVTFAILLPGIEVLWLLGCALSGRLVARHWRLAAMVAAFAAWSLIAAMKASDKRSALDVWIEQLSLMSACLLALQLFGDRRRFVAFVAVLAGIGGVLAAKGWWQVGAEIPERIADFVANRQARLAELGLASGSVEAEIFEARLRATTPTGFFVMSNLYASLLVIALAAAVGLAADKTALAFATWRHSRYSRRKGQVHLPAISAILAGIMAVACAAALVLSRSRGGIVAAAVSLLAGVAAARWKHSLAAHWRKGFIAAAATFVLAAGAIVAYGGARDGLPTKTMTFRWHYWTGGAKIVADHPWFGVGPGNFGPAYLRYRRAAAEEAVKDPHNVIVHAATQYGLPGGAVYLAIVAYVLVAMARPRREVEQVPSPSAKRIPTVLMVAAATVTALATRALVTGSTVNAYYFVIDTAVPAAVFAVMLTVAIWTGWREPTGTIAPAQPAPPPGDAGTGEFLKPEFSRIALACGLAGFVLHGMIEFAPWAPGAALVFWTAAGACLAQAGAVKELDVSRLRWLKVVTAGACVAAAVVVLWRPVCARIALTEAASAELVAGNISAAAELAEQAATRDALDPWSPADAARLVLAGCQRQGPETLADLERASRCALQACLRDPSYYGHARLLANIDWMLAAPDAFAYSWSGIAGGSAAFEESCRQAAQAGRPTAMSDLAGLLQSRGDYVKAAEWLRKAIKQDGNSHVLYAHLAEVLWRGGRLDDAAEAWRGSARLMPRNRRVEDSLNLMRLTAEALNPMDLRLRLEYAEMLVSCGSATECLKQLAAAEEINNALPRESLLRFNASETGQLNMLRARAEAVLRFQAAGPVVVRGGL